MLLCRFSYRRPPMDGTELRSKRRMTDTLTPVRCNRGALNQTSRHFTFLLSSVEYLHFSLLTPFRSVTRNLSRMGFDHYDLVSRNKRGIGSFYILLSKYCETPGTRRFEEKLQIRANNIIFTIFYQRRLNNQNGFIYVRNFCRVTEK